MTTTNRRLRVIVGCEFSGRVRDAFLALGHDAWSCDTMASPDDHPRHIQGDIFEVIKTHSTFDIGIFHPPCTYLTNSAAWAYVDKPMLKGRPRKINEGTLIGSARRQARIESLMFVLDLWRLPIKRVCIENPAGVISTSLDLGVRPQYVQPNWFGDDRSKTTGLWLRGLPELKPTIIIPPKIVEHPVGSGKMVKRWSNQSVCGADSTPPGPDRWKIRSLLSQGMVDAMAAQWGG